MLGKINPISRAIDFMVIQIKENAITINVYDITKI